MPSNFLQKKSQRFFFKDICSKDAQSIFHLLSIFSTGFQFILSFFTLPQQNTMQQTSHSLGRSHKNFGETGSTMYQTMKHNPSMSSSGNKRVSLRFERVTRDNIRLDSTIKCEELEKSKFHKINCKSGFGFKWNNWKYSGFPIVSESFKKHLQVKVQKTCQEQAKNERIKPQELKIRHKIREVAKLKEDVCKAQQNNRLIKLIEDAHNGKIKVFFEELEKYLNK